jgi:hypothetical protein
MHGYAKALEKLDQAQKAQKIVNQQVVAHIPPPQYVQVQPVQQKQCLKKVQQAPATFEPVPPVNESFDYSMTDPLVDEITSYSPDIMSTTGISSMKNSML